MKVGHLSKKLASSVVAEAGTEVAKKEECDIYISGDAPHHVRRDIVNAKFNYLDLPHEIEKIFMPKMEKYLLSIDKDLIIQSFDHERLPKVV